MQCIFSFSRIPILLQYLMLVTQLIINHHLPPYIAHLLSLLCGKPFEKYQNRCGNVHLIAANALTNDVPTNLTQPVESSLPHPFANQLTLLCNDKASNSLNANSNNNRKNNSAEEERERDKFDNENHMSSLLTVKWFHFPAQWAHICPWN